MRIKRVGIRGSNVFVSGSAAFFCLVTRTWHPAVRAIIALAPLVPSLLYVRSIARWIGGMDRLQRRLLAARSLSL